MGHVLLPIMGCPLDDLQTSELFGAPVKPEYHKEIIIRIIEKRFES
jgi:hypothetical protein